MRINKRISEMGICSRRQCDVLIEEGRILVNGQPALMGQQVDEQDEIQVDGKVYENKKEEEVILAYYKPRGVVCTTKGFKDEINIIEAIHYPVRIYPVGRLDKDSEGLILLTNNGELMDQIIRGQNGHEKEYYVKVHKPMTQEVIKAMEQGVPILDTMTKPCKIDMVAPNKFYITITQGLNRQIRRMCNYFGYNVQFLKRLRVINIELGDLKEGEYRELSKDEIDKLKSITKGKRYYNDKK